MRKSKRNPVVEIGGHRVEMTMSEFLEWEAAKSGRSPSRAPQASVEEEIIVIAPSTSKRQSAIQAARQRSEISAKSEDEKLDEYLSALDKERKYIEAVERGSESGKEPPSKLQGNVLVWSIGTEWCPGYSDVKKQLQQKFSAAGFDPDHVTASAVLQHMGMTRYTLAKALHEMASVPGLRYGDPDHVSKAYVKRPELVEQAVAILSKYGMKCVVPALPNRGRAKRNPSYPIPLQYPAQNYQYSPPPVIANWTSHPSWAYSTFLRNNPLKEVPAYIPQTPREAATHISAIGVPGEWPIGDLFHARLAMIYILSPSHEAVRNKVIRAVREHYPEYDWMGWLHDKTQELEDSYKWQDAPVPRGREVIKEFPHPAQEKKWWSKILSRNNPKPSIAASDWDAAYRRAEARKDKALMGILREVKAMGAVASAGSARRGGKRRLGKSEAHRNPDAPKTSVPLPWYYDRMFTVSRANPETASASVEMPTNAGPYLPDMFPYGQGGRPAKLNPRKKKSKG